MSIDLSLTPQQEQLLREQLANGRYQDAGELVATALRLLDEKCPPTARSGRSAEFAFGLWKGRAPDGLAYERDVRADWHQ